MIRCEHKKRVPRVLLRLVSQTLLGVGLTLPLVALGSHAQAATAITPTTGLGNLGTNVTPSGNVYGITGGQTAGNNLFHSFAQFSVGTGDIAQFRTSTFVPDTTLSNILSRVTGGNPSAIFGTIDSATYYPSANLFLMNPAGILFGPGVQINVGGIMHITTSDYLKLADGNLFNAMPDIAADTLLSTFPVAAFGFLGSNPAAIAVQGSQLTVASGTGLSLVGGNQGFTYTDPDTDLPALVPIGVTMTGGSLSAPSGQINLVSVASPGEVSTVDFTPSSSMTLGDISLSQGTSLEVSGNGAGIIRIRGGQFIMDQAAATANTTGASDGTPTAISIAVVGDFTLTNTSSISARSLGTGNSGHVEVSAFDIFIDGGSTITTESRDTGFTGDITLNAPGTISITGTDSSDAPSTVKTEGPSGAIMVTASNVVIDGQAMITSTTSNAGAAGDITLTTENITITNGGGIVTSGGEFFPSGNIHITATNAISVLGQLDLSNLSRIANENGGSGGTGNIVVGTTDLLLSGGGRILSDTFFSPNPPEGPKVLVTSSGSVSVSQGSDILVRGFISDVGPLELSARTLTLTDRGVISTLTFAEGNAGSIRLTADDIALSGGGQITSSSLVGAGKAGTVEVNAQNRLSLAGQGIDEFGNPAPSGIFSSTRADFPDPSFTGDAGTITLAAKTLEMSNGARIDSSSIGYALGNAGQIIVSAPTILINGGSISTSTEFSGNAGAIQINTGSLTVNQVGRLTSSSFMRTIPFFDGEEIPTPTGSAGAITVESLANLAQSILIDGAGSGIFTDTEGTGAGGNIFVSANSVTMNNGSSVSASSTGPGNAGNISINAGQQFEMRNSSVKTEAAQASGGNINIQAIDQVRLVNSTISTSVFGGAGSGGNITIDPNVVVLQNSNVIAQAIQGAGGNITITTPLFLADSTSLVSASSQFGLNGTVTIQSPTSNLSESLGTLTSQPSQAQSLLTQRCAALANGQASSFVVAGREQLPADPEGWLTSPLAFAGLDADPFKDGTVAEGTSNFAPRTSGLLANDRVSLRRLTPAGFLIANFADSEATGCHS